MDWFFIFLTYWLRMTILINIGNSKVVCTLGKMTRVRVRNIELNRRNNKGMCYRIYIMISHKQSKKSLLKDKVVTS